MEIDVRIEYEIARYLASVIIIIKEVEGFIRKNLIFLIETSILKTTFLHYIS